MAVHTMTLDDQELQLLHSSLNTFVNSFTHDQPDLLRSGKLLRARLEDEMTHTGDTGTPASPRATGFGTQVPS